jgi:septum site-determining protein MinD
VGRVISVVSGKGGVGKTTFVSNVSTILVQHFNRDVAVVDCNLTTSHLGFFMGIFFSPVTLNNVLKGEASIEEATYVHPSGVKVVPASLALTDLEGIDMMKLNDALKGLTERTEIVFLDAAPGLGREAMAAIRASQEAIFITTPFLPCVADVIRTKEVVEQVGVRPLGIVLNMVTGDRREMKKEEVESMSGLPVLAEIPFDKTIRTSLSMSVPVFLLNPKAKASKELLKFAAGLIGLEYRKSWLERVFERIKIW